MTIPTTGWDETSPAGSQKVNLGDNRIREMKTQIREVLEVDHKFGSSGQDADNGKHKKVSLLEQANLGTGSTGEPILGAQTVSGKAELVYTDEDDNDLILTSQNKIGHSTTNGVIDDLEVVGNLTLSTAAKAYLMGLIYPVGAVVTLGVSTNPGTLFGVGTWTAIAGRVIVGIDAGQTEFDTLDETGGAKTHILQTSEIPAHTHSVELLSGGSGTGNGGFSNTSTGTTGSTGGGGAHNNLQPYIVKYVWQRTA